MPEVRMSVEEYLALVEQSMTAPNRKQPARAEKMTMKVKRKGKAAKGMARAMKDANKKLRTKSGKLRKGKTQADVARLAHKIRRQKYA
tara:strand:+ start:228 stop:491 length:264 start_codon:yes stop_codon:yes gene_type:complete